MEELLKRKLELAKQGFITLYLWEKDMINCFKDYLLPQSRVTDLPEMYVTNLLGGDWEIASMQTLPALEFEKGFKIKLYSQSLFEYHENLARIERMSQEEYFIEQLQIAI